jgi:predicted PurR-regulated permease PerM
MFVPFFGIICAIACYKIAIAKGRNPKLWAVLGLLTNAIAVIVILILPNLLAAPNLQPGSNVLNSIQNSLQTLWARIRNSLVSANGGQTNQLPPAITNLQTKVGTIFKKPPTVSSIATQIRELAQLRDDGMISDIEYQDKKQKLLDSI